MNRFHMQLRASRPRALGLCLALLALLFAPALGAAPAPPRQVVVVHLDSIIHPVAAELVEHGIEAAEKNGAQALIIEIDTPGGVMTSMRKISTDILSAHVPVVVWVAPSGARAASAGFYILMSADIAAMAPGTNTGAAHPVGPQGGDIGGTEGKKIEEDSAANIRSLAKTHGRNVELAEAAVLKSKSFTAGEAKKNGLIDLVSPTLKDLLQQIDGREVVKANGASYHLATVGAAVQDVELSGLQRFLALLADPNLLYLLLTLGFLGLVIELGHPGLIFPGVVGTIFLILGLYGVSVLPLNYAGLALIFLAMLLFIAELKITSYGLLTVSGVICLVLGSLMLFRSSDPALKVSLWLIAGVTSATVTVALFLMFVVVRTHRGRVTTGAEGLVGEQGVTRSALAPVGKVFVHGEIWDATAEGSVDRGVAVEVTAVEHLQLRVRPLTAVEEGAALSAAKPAPQVEGS